MTITARQKAILKAVVKEYVRSAKPVASQQLEDKYDFGIKPASIRIEMQKLTDEGFLNQPHTSAGRTPTDKGYRLFVNELLNSHHYAVPQDLKIKSKEFASDEFENFFCALQNLSKSIAQFSESLVVGYLEEEGVLWKEGFEEVLRQPEFEQKDLIDDLLDYLEYLEANVEKLKPNSDFELLIGQENPCPKAREFATFALSFELFDAREVIMSIVGPKRMPYDKNIALIIQVIKMFDQM